MAAMHIDGVESIEIKRGVACVVAVSAGERIKWKMPEDVFRRALMLANAVMSDHDHPATGERVVPIKRTKLDKLFE